MGKAKLLAAAGTEKAQTVVSSTRSALTRNSRCRAGRGGNEDSVASADAEGCCVDESCQREGIQAGNDVRSPSSARLCTFSVVFSRQNGPRYWSTKCQLF